MNSTVLNENMSHHHKRPTDVGSTLVADDDDEGGRNGNGTKRSLQHEWSSSKREKNSPLTSEFDENEKRNGADDSSEQDRRCRHSSSSSSSASAPPRVRPGEISRRGTRSSRDKSLDRLVVADNDPNKENESDRVDVSDDEYYDYDEDDGDKSTRGDTEPLTNGPDVAINGDKLSPIEDKENGPTESLGIKSDKNNNFVFGDEIVEKIMQHSSEETKNFISNLIGSGKTNNQSAEFTGVTHKQISDVRICILFVSWVLDHKIDQI